MDLIAHRAGNSPETLPAALAIADWIELDVHLFRGRLEVRHAKVLWPFALRWERWERLPDDAPRPTLEEILAHVPAGSALWFDLKGFVPSLTRRAVRAADHRYRLTVSARAWWILPTARRRTDVRVVRSIGSRLQRWLALALPRDLRDGVVIHSRLVGPRTVSQLRRVASSVTVYGANDVGRVRELVALGVDGLILDDLELIATVRELVRRQR